MIYLLWYALQPLAPYYLPEFQKKLDLPSIPKDMKISKHREDKPALSPQASEPRV